MERYEVKRINNLLNCDLDSLIKQSKEDGFRFVERLINDYKDGSNTFNRSGEGLFGVFSVAGDLVAIGGLNKDPFSKEHSIGRVRRFFVRKEHSKKGIGSLLLKKIMDDANSYYDILVLHTDTVQADKFYTNLGFSKSNLYVHSSHYIDLKS